ncbi:MAG: MFS transporter [Acidimicrobiales bacterium]|nr:MFS transporter [Acidimicrobiales bacterium]
MKAQPAALFRSDRARAVASYPFRLGPAESKWTGTPFAGLAIVNNLSGAGDAFMTVALAGSVFVSVSLHAARGRTALGLICTVLPFAVVGPFVGPAIDRVRGGRKFIVFLAAIGRMASCLMMAAWIHSLLLFPAAFLGLVCSKTHAVAKASLVPGVVEREEDLVRANSKLAVGGSIFTSLGAALAGAMYKLFGSRAVLDFDVLVFAAVAALSLYLLSGSREPASGDAGPQDVMAPARQPGAGLRAALRALRLEHRVPIPRELALAQVAMAGMRAVAGFLTALVVFAFRREGAPLIWYGLVASASVGGNFGGALIAPRLRDRVTERRLVGGAALVIGLTAVAVTQMGGLHRRPAALVLAAVVALGASVAKTAFDAIVQKDTRDWVRSRLFARFESIFQLVWVVGALIPTLIATSLLVGFVLTAITVLATSGLFIVGLARAPAQAVHPAQPVQPVQPVSRPPSSAPPSYVPEQPGWGPAAAPFLPPRPPADQ